MTETERVLSKALNLPITERARVAERLICSLDGEAADLDVELSWQREIQSRLAAMDRGEVSFVSWNEVRDRLRRQTAG